MNLLEKIKKTLTTESLPAAASSERDRDRAAPPGADSGIDAVVDAGLDWLCAAQDHSASRDGGVARDYSLVKGWASSYPETTGYIIPTIIDLARRTQGSDLHERARRMVDWCVAIQFPEGGFQGGKIDAQPRVPVTFNTGQILLGLAAGAAEYRDPRYIDAAFRAPYSEIHETVFYSMGPRLCIFSKHKITAVRFVEYDEGDDWDAKAAKGVLGVLIEPAGEPPLRVFFTHTQSGPYSKTRTTQFQQISELMGTFHPEIRHRTLVAGDLNVSAEILQPKEPSPEYHQMLGLLGGLKDAVPTCEPQYTSDGKKNCLKKYFSKGDDSQARLDYVLFSGNFVLKEAKVLNDWLWSGDHDHPCKDCSDHYPLMVSFEC